MTRISKIEPVTTWTEGPGKKTVRTFRACILLQALVVRAALAGSPGNLVPRISCAFPRPTMRGESRQETCFGCCSWKPSRGCAGHVVAKCGTAVEATKRKSFRKCEA